MTNVLAEAEAVARRSYARPIVIATIARPVGWTGVHTHFTEFMRVLEGIGHRASLVTPLYAAIGRPIERFAQRAPHLHAALRILNQNRAEFYCICTTMRRTRKSRRA